MKSKYSLLILVPAMIVLLGWLKVDAKLAKVIIVDHPVEIAVNQNTNCAYVANDEKKLSVIGGETIVDEVEVGEDGLDIGRKRKYTRGIAINPQTNLSLIDYPNPFNPDTFLPFKLAKEAKVTINIYNVQGQLI